MRVCVHAQTDRQRRDFIVIVFNIYCRNVRKCKRSAFERAGGISINSLGLGRVLSLLQGVRFVPVHTHTRLQTLVHMPAWANIQTHTLTFECENSSAYSDL